MSGVVPGDCRVPRPPRLDRRDAAVALACAAAVALALLPVLLRERTRGDFIGHVGFAMYLDRQHVLMNPHFLFQVVTVLVKRAFLLERYMTAGLGVALAANAGAAAVAYIALRRADAGRTLAALAAGALPLVSQVYLLAPFDHELYWGYLAPNVTHSPTYHVLKPFALLAFLSAERAFAPEAPNARGAALAAAAVVLATLAKPNYTIALLPALAACALALLPRGRTRPHPGFMALGIALPATLVLAAQWYITYSPAAVSFGGAFAGRSALIYAPLAVMRHYSSWLLPKLLLSLLFPLGVLLLPGARRERALGLAWATFAFGAAYAYLLAESGERLWGGNFLWSAYIALFVLFFASARLLCQRLAGLPVRSVVRDPRLVLCLAAFVLHLGCGLAFVLVFRGTQHLT